MSEQDKRIRALEKKVAELQKAVRTLVEAEKTFAEAGLKTPPMFTEEVLRREGGVTLVKEPMTGNFTIIDRSGERVSYAKEPLANKVFEKMLGRATEGEGHSS